VPAENVVIGRKDGKVINNRIGNSHFYEQLKRDKEQLRRKYGKKKGKATRGLTTDSLYPQVAYRPLTEYEQFAQGGVAWNN
jgi:hypothetical protein